MQITFKSLVLSTAAFCATAAFAANQARVDVPFSFTAKGQTYPAGSYDVTLDSNSSFITLASKADPNKHFTWTAQSADAAASPAVVKFDEVGSNHALKSIQMGNEATPNLNTPSKGGISATTSIAGQ
jgi:hypothetical protein